METAASKQNSRDRVSGETVRVANREETIVGVPVIVPPIEVQVPLGIVPVEVRHVAVAVDLADGASCEKPSMPLPSDRFARAVSNP
jgi:hypothetical protein